MEFTKVHLEEIRHEHPLSFVDMQSIYQNYEEDDDDFDDNDLIVGQNFKCLCDLFGFQIDWYHRYYYKCTRSCNYSLHKFCAKMSTTLQFPAHPDHILILNKVSKDWTCHSCLTKNRYGMCYLCSTCNYEIDLRCVTFVKQNTIHHPSHPHPLVYVIGDPIVCKCFACGKKHEGIFYHCTTCFNFSIHIDCVTLPVKFLLQNDHFIHTHMLTLSYSSPVTPYGCKCRICEMNISYGLWLYKCSKCRYYAHLDCATSRGEPFMSIFSTGIGKSNKNFEVVDYPDLLQFPPPDESYILQQYMIRKKDRLHVENRIDENGYFLHFSHEHPLVLIDTEGNKGTTIRNLMPLHNPMKRIKVLCNGCSRPVTTMPFYKCSQEDKGCNFCLHEWCTMLPYLLQNYPGHSQHSLMLSFDHNISDMSRSLKKKNKRNLVVVTCDNCGLPSNGFRYSCFKCNYHIDVSCAIIPEVITHEAHSSHLLLRSKTSSILSTVGCHACHAIIQSNEICFRCNACDFYLDCRCALHLPKTIRHKYDKHSLKLSYSPIENHKGQYFCEICEEDLNPEKWFYHCSECKQSIHSACSLLILKSEQDITLRKEGVYIFINMKFGDIGKFKYHEHPLSFVAGTKRCGKCSFCGSQLQSKLILKCLRCKFAVDIQCYFAPPFIFTFYLPEPPSFKKPPQPQPIATFYPSGIIRPATGQWKPLDDV